MRGKHSRGDNVLVGVGDTFCVVGNVDRSGRLLFVLFVVLLPTRRLPKRKGSVLRHKARIVDIDRGVCGKIYCFFHYIATFNCRNLID